MMYEKYYVFFGLIPRYRIVTSIEKLEQRISEIEILSAFSRTSVFPMFNERDSKITNGKPAIFIIEGKKDEQN